MSNRLTRLYTRTGDAGTTGLADGMRLSKDHARIEAIGDVDELNSAIGAVIAQPLAAPMRPVLTRVQNDLFELGGELAQGRASLGGEDVAGLEAAIDDLNGPLPPLREFILPGGGTAAAACHLARAISRRAERRLVALAGVEPVRPELLAYLNRLADLLFVIARLLARADGGEVYWQPRKAKPE